MVIDVCSYFYLLIVRERWTIIVHEQEVFFSGMKDVDRRMSFLSECEREFCCDLFVSYSYQRV